MKNLVILATQRSGSTLLCRDLAASGVVGLPKEHFISVFRAYNSGNYLEDNYETPQQIQKRVQDQDGIFSVKIMSDQLQSISDVSERLRKGMGVSVLERPSEYLKNLLRDGVVLRVRRTDKIAQAISRHVATQRGYHHSFELAAGPQASEIKETYDFEKIRSHLANIRREETFLDEFCLRTMHGLAVKELVYEEFGFDDSRNHVFKVLSLLDREPKPLSERKMRRVTSPFLEAWRARFEEDSKMK